MKKRSGAHIKRDDKKTGEIKIYISPMTFVMAVVFVALGMAYEFMCSLTAVMLHELAHARAAKKLGYALNEIKLMPYGAALCGKADMSPKHELAIAAAGPIVNFALAVVFAAIWWTAPVTYAFTSVFCMCNLYIGAFNLLPVYPLDGGRMALSLLSLRHDRRKAYKTMRIVSAALGLAAVVYFVISALHSPNLCFLAVGVFMISSAFLPDARARYYALFAFTGRKRRLDRPLAVRRYAVTQEAALIELWKMLDPDGFAVFDIYDGKLEKIGELDEGALVSAVKGLGYGATAAQALKHV